MKQNKKTTILILGCLTIIAFCLRIFLAGRAALKEDENTTVAAAAYIYFCQKDPSQCRRQPTSLKNKFLALITANETVPNLGAEIYFWDFIKDKASEVHYSRAWPHLYALTGVYHFFGINEWSSRIVSVIAGSLLVLVGYWFSRILGASMYFSLWYAGLLAIAFPLIDFSRIARMYSLYALVFLLLAGKIYQSKWLTAGVLLILAYWLHLLTLILPVAVLIFALITHRKILASGLVLGFISLICLNYWLEIDFFQRQFLAWTWPPHWEYIKLLFSFPLPWWLGIIFFFKGKSKYLKVIIITYLCILIFGINFPPGGAYVFALLPLVILEQFNWIKSKWLLRIIFLFAFIRLIAGSGYLYFGRDDRAQITRAYPALIRSFKPGDKIYAVQLRDYYLQKLPPETEVIDLQKNPQPEFSGSGFVVWEKEKAVHFQPELLEYIKNNFRHLTGIGLDNWGVEIYSFGK